MNSKAAAAPDRDNPGCGSAIGIATIAVRDAGMTYESKRADSLTVYEDLDFDVREGEFVSVVGPSGCGKSTLLRNISGLVPATAGSVMIDGERVTRPSPEIGLVFQSPVLFDWQTVINNVLVPVRVLHGDLGVARGRAMELLAMVGLEQAVDKYPFELSGGMQQRTSIARALIHDPRILLMDEPFGALDALSREQLNLDLQRIWQADRKTVVFVTHSIPEAVFLSDRVMVLGDTPATIQTTVEVELARPRELEVMSTPAFGRLTQRLRRALKAEGSLD